MYDFMKRACVIDPMKLNDLAGEALIDGMPDVAANYLMMAAESPLVVTESARVVLRERAKQCLMETEAAHV